MKSIKQKRLFLGLILLLVFSVALSALNVSAANLFSVTAGASSTSLCPRETGLFTDVVKNTDSVAHEFSVNVKGSAAPWVTSVPNSFILLPGESKTIYTYATPLQNSIPSNYDVILTIASSGQNQEVTHKVTVRKCYGSTLTSNQFNQRTCPGEVVKYEVSLTNNGEYRDGFILSVDGQLADKVTLSDKLVTLDKGETKKIYAYVNAPKYDGAYSFNVESVGQLGKQADNFNAVLTVDPCYTFNVAINSESSQSLCERTALNIPITVENKGTVANTFTASLNGPQWAKFDRNQFSIGPGQKTYVNLMVAPDYGIAGDFKVNANIVPQKGDLKAATDFNFNVRKCHSVGLIFLEQNVSVCNGLQKTFSAVVTNDGEVTKQYKVNVESPNWVVSNLKDTLITLDPKKQQTITFTAKPGENVNESAYLVKVTVNAIDDSKNVVFASASTQLFNILPSTCYKPSISTQYDAITVYYDSSVTLPLAIKNEGMNNVNYELVLSGTATNFVKLAPLTVPAEAGKSEMSYLYIAPTPHLTLGQYDAAVSVKLKDGSFLLTRTIPITVTDDKTKATALGVVDKNLPALTLTNDGSVSLWQKAKNWIVSKWNKYFPKKGVSPETVAEEEAVNPLVDKEIKEVSAEVNAVDNVKDIEVKEENTENRSSVSAETQAQALSIKEKLLKYKFQVLVGIIILLVLIIFIRLDVFGKLNKWLDEE